MTNSDVLEPESRRRYGRLIHRGPVGISREWFGRLISRIVPVGYEDESGFHYEMEPVASGAAGQGMLTPD